MRLIIRFVSISILLIWAVPAFAGVLYTHAFGSSKNPAIIFLHGGPGYNCAAFEISTAKRLSDSGYFVIVYDMRGCARSSGTNAEYTL